MIPPMGRGTSKLILGACTEFAHSQYSQPLLEGSSNAGSVAACYTYQLMHKSVKHHTHTHTHTHTHNRVTALCPDYPGKPVPER